jgi:hypothetical protein
MVVLDPLPGGEVVFDQRGTDSRYLIGANRRPDAAAADGHPALDLSRRHSPGQGDDEVRIIVARIQGMGSEIDDLMPRRAKMSNQFFLQAKPTMVRSNSDAHIIHLADATLSFP